jgi:xylan 1,4-beta-xylosidase
MTLRKLRYGLLAGLLAVPCFAQEEIKIDSLAKSTPFPHFWEQMFGSGRAILSLRESYRDDLRAVKQVTDIRYVRFHAIFHDEVGVYNEDEHGNPVYNFAYLDQIYDGLLKNGVRPLVEISFMPKKLAFNPDALHPFWYKPNVSPPKSMERWDGLIVAFAKHLVERYGEDEVAQWYFEVWNEPNIDFWGGIPREKSYFDLYDHTARALKSVNLRIRVGGPATAAAAWVDTFLKHTTEQKVPVDFVSSHGYADDTVDDLFGSNEDIPMNDRVCRAVSKVKGQMSAAGKSELPLLWTEWNVPGMEEARDTAFVGPALAHTIRGCDGLAQALSFWTFSDVFEEGGPIEKPFEGHFGLRAEYGINKPSYYDFALLHRLGETRLANDNPSTIVTKRKDGKLVIALWNYVDPGQKGNVKKYRLVFEDLPLAGAEVSENRVDEDHSNTLKAYRSMGSPRYPTEEQVKKLNTMTALEPPNVRPLKAKQLDIELGPNALVVLEVKPGATKQHGLRK